MPVSNLQMSVMCSSLFILSHCVINTYLKRYFLNSHRLPIPERLSTYLKKEHKCKSVHYSHTVELSQVFYFKIRIQ